MDIDDIRRLVAAAGLIFRGSVLHHWTGEAPVGIGALVPGLTAVWT
jgi:hypothetical protein